MKEDNVKYYSYAIGRDLNKCRNVFLIAPPSYLLEIGDIVADDNGSTYKIMFSRHYTTLESPDVLAMKIALDMRPIKIRKKLTEEIFEWDKEGEDNNDTV